MTIADYEALTGITVPAQDQAFVTAQIGKTQRILERMLGFTLNQAGAHANQYVESGKSQTECPCPGSTGTLLPADPVVTAYRLYSYNKKDKYLNIDPASAINKVKLVSGTVTLRTLDPDEYRPHYANGFIKALEQVECFCTCRAECGCVQLAVDANWLWFTGTDIPDDLLDVWAEMITEYSDPKSDIQSETLGPHSYKKFDRGLPEENDINVAIIKKYAGPLGSVQRIVTV